MNTTYGDKLEELFEQALALPSGQRTAFLDQVCAGDAALREELTSLLSHYDEAPAFFESLGEAVLPPALASLEASSGEGGSDDPYGFSGSTLGPYLVLEKLGGGGMGVVYRAEDTRLKRIVALKFLPPQWNQEESAKQRFIQEAQAASGLDHTNICTIYEVGETGDGRLFIAMACYEGETLKSTIERGPVPIDQALDYAAQAARGLAKAHAAGIVHRDVKPGNLMVRDDNVVKILDFGLAKMVDSHLTQSGMTMGTIAYMSPEQARGEVVDHRADIWALGVVLYEMVTGERPFRGDYDQAVIYLVLNEDPVPPTQVNPDVPEALELVVMRCLEKDRALRYPSMTDLLADLEVVAQGAGAALSVAFPAPRRLPPTVRRGVVVGLGVFVAILLLLAIPGVRRAVLGLAIPDQRHLAVLPFINVGGDPANQAFTDGLLHTVTGKLSGMEPFQDALWVVPAADVLQFGVASSREAAREFGVNLVVTGSVQRTGDAVRLTLTLVDAKKGRELNALVLDERLTNITALQDGVVQKLAELLKVELNPASQQVLTAGHTTSSVAYDFYTQGLGYLQRFEDETNVEAAASLFGLAIKEDSSYALAYAGLGEAYVRKYWATNDPHWIDEATQTGERAVVLDDDLPPVRVTLGMIYNETGRYEKAELEFLRALALEPDHAEAHHQLGSIYEKQNKLDKAEESYKKAIDVKNNHWLYWNDLGQFYHRLGRHEEAIPQFKQVITLVPENPWGYNNVGAQYHRLGDFEEAIAWYQQAIEVNPNASAPTARAYKNLGDIFFAKRNFAEAAQMYRKVTRIHETDLSGWPLLGESYYWSGKLDEARESWQRAIELANKQLAVNSQHTGALRILALVYAQLGDHEKARIMIDRLLALERNDADALFIIGATHEILNQRELAIQYIEEALANGLTLTSLEESPWLDDLRNDPQYQQRIEPYRRP